MQCGRYDFLAPNNAILLVAVGEVLGECAALRDEGWIGPDDVCVRLARPE